MNKIILIIFYFKGIIQLIKYFITELKFQFTKQKYYTLQKKKKLRVEIRIRLNIFLNLSSHWEIQASWNKNPDF